MYFSRQSIALQLWLLWPAAAIDDVDVQCALRELNEWKKGKWTEGDALDRRNALPRCGNRNVNGTGRLHRATAGIDYIFISLAIIYCCWAQTATNGTICKDRTRQSQWQATRERACAHSFSLPIYRLRVLNLCLLHCTSQLSWILHKRFPVFPFGFDFGAVDINAVEVAAVWAGSAITFFSPQISNDFRTTHTTNPCKLSQFSGAEAHGTSVASSARAHTVAIVLNFAAQRMSRSRDYPSRSFVCIETAHKIRFWYLFVRFVVIRVVRSRFLSPFK